MKEIFHLPKELWNCLHHNKSLLDISHFSNGLQNHPSTSSPKGLGPSHDQGAVKQVPSVPGAGHSLSCHEILQNLLSSTVTLETSSSVQRAVEAPLDKQGALPLLPHFQGCLGPSQYTPKTSESLPSHQF